MKEYDAIELSRIKGADRVQINNILSAICLAALSVLIGVSGHYYSVLGVGQLALAIPALVTSSLAYAKMGYRPIQEHRMWDNLGWATHTLGYIMVLNSIVLILYNSDYSEISYTFTGFTILIFFVYSVLDVFANKKRLKEKAIKFFIYFTLIGLGSVLPMYFDWI